MVGILRSYLVLLALPALAVATVVSAPGQVREHALIQTWDRALEGAGGSSSAKGNPVERVVSLLKEMQDTLKKEMDEDEELHDKLMCWCNTNEWEKGNAISEAEATIAQLKATIERLTALSKELKATIKELEEKVAADKEELAEATAIREKELKAFHGGELDSIQAIENLKAAITILSKHAVGNTLPNLKTEKDAWDSSDMKDSKALWDKGASFLAVGKAGKKDAPWAPSESRLDRSLDEFMEKMGVDAGSASSQRTDREVQKFLQQDGAPQVPSRPAPEGWSVTDTAVVQRALKSASAFVQSRHLSGYYPSYTAKSGEIVGILKQLKEEMEGDLSEAQKKEMAAAAAFKELRDAKEAEIAAAEKQAEEKEDELAQTDMDNANAKEDLEKEEAALSEYQKFMMNLKKTCADAEANFELRKKARLDEIKAVSETIEILTEDEARDAMQGTYSLVQLSSRAHRVDGRRLRAASLLRNIAAKTHSPELSALATTVELDAFTRVKKAIDDMIAMLKQQQADEVKHKDWCTSELQETNMTSMKTEDLRADLEAKIAELDATIKQLGGEIESAKLQITELHGMLQRATIDRQKANLDFQKTVADQRATQAVLAKALDKLATYYDKASFLQTLRRGERQTPPVPIMEYKPSRGAAGVMQMIEKLIYEAKDLEAESVKGEAEAQAQYEGVVSETNSSVDALIREIAAKTKALSQAKKDRTQAEADMMDAIKELERLAKYAADLHAACDYVLKNFMLRQEARGKEIEALQQAKQILSGADLS